MFCKKKQIGLNSSNNIETKYKNMIYITDVNVH